MRTEEPILTHGRDHWDRVSLPVAAFEERVARVRDEMEREGVDALLLYGTGDRDGDIAYVSNLVHKVPGFPLSLVVTMDTVVVVNQRSSRTRPIVERSTWVEDVHFTRDLWATFDDLLEEVARPDDRVGFVGTDAMGHLAHERLDELVDAWPIEVRDGFLDGLRAVKDERERNQVRRAGGVLRAVEDFLEESVRAPIRERELHARLDRLARLHGAQDVRFLVSNPAHTEGAHRPAEDVVIEPGDPLGYYLAVRFEGYWASLARATTLDDEPAVGDDVEAADEVLDDLVGSLAPGADAAAAVGDARDAVEAAGLELDQRYDVLAGLGLELDEPPMLDAGDEWDETVLEPGHCLEVTLPVTGGDGEPILVGETVVVTEDGAERVTGSAGE